VVGPVKVLSTLLREKAESGDRSKKDYGQRDQEGKNGSKIGNWSTTVFPGIDNLGQGTEFSNPVPDTGEKGRTCSKKNLKRPPQKGMTRGSKQGGKLDGKGVTRKDNKCRLGGRSEGSKGAFLKKSRDPIW